MYFREADGDFPGRLLPRQYFRIDRRLSNDQMVQILHTDDPAAK
jgi:hypothetical protein